MQIMTRLGNFAQNAVTYSRTILRKVAHESCIPGLRTNVSLANRVVFISYLKSAVSGCVLRSFHNIPYPPSLSSLLQPTHLSALYRRVADGQRQNPVPLPAVANAADYSKRISTPNFSPNRKRYRGPGDNRLRCVLNPYPGKPKVILSLIGRLKSCATSITCLMHIKSES